ncbi:FecR family protein [Pseudomonas xanthosomatis]|uniref:FecR domain-containing protein n=1 Tax=Pseudomonas xanthosomatis TaxID=2842356 RepID=UPI001C3DB6D0|nr:FecR family protein [Pseudomonas xanthosomatis]QXH44189.1 FecR family protein [Pseudomonas xanthosomatis]
MSDQASLLAREAAQWLALQDAGELSAEQAAELGRWRQRSAAHEALWQKAEGLRRRFAEVPAPLAVACLDRPDPGRRRLLGQALAAGGLLPLAWLGYRQLPVASWRADLHTATGERRGLTLPDGTRLQLNTASAVNLDFAQGRHRLQLVAGEIAVDGSGPLQVEVGQGLLQTWGASFCVRQDEGRCVVSVGRGQVDVQPLSGAVLRLGAGQRVAFGAAGAAAPETFDAQLPGWQQGLLIADDQPLGELLRELRRYRPGLLRWDPALELLRVTGTFQLDDTDRIFALLTASLPLQVHYRTRYWVSLAPRQLAG